MITFDRVSFTYNNAGVDAGVHDINLDIPAGQVVLLCGSSGCGKTTLTRLINGLIPHFYEGTLTGNVTVDGCTVDETPLHALAPIVGSVFQNPKSQFYTVETDSEIVFGCENIGLPKEQIYERFETVVSALSLDPLLGHSLFALSGGQKQKIACASVAALHPQVLVMDEPSSNLDISAVSELAAIIRKWKEKGHTIVIAEHRLYWLMDLADRVVIMDRGRIVEDLSIDAFRRLTPQALAERGLRAREISFEGVHLSGAVSDEMLYFNDMVFSYGREQALEIPSLKIPCGSIVAVIGPNGAGKSTFGRCLCGLEKKMQGTISLRGKVLNHKERIRRSYLVMQDVNHQLFTESVEEEVMLSMEKADLSDAQKSEQVQEILQTMHLEDFAQMHPMALSGGQKQRVSVACAFASDKEMLVYDEPTSGLDHARMLDVAEAMKTMQTRGKTQFVITHDPELMEQVCDYLLFLEKGHVRCAGPFNDACVQVIEEFFSLRSLSDK